MESEKQNEIYYATFIRPRPSVSDTYYSQRGKTTLAEACSTRWLSGRQWHQLSLKRVVQKWMAWETIKFHTYYHWQNLSQVLREIKLKRQKCGRKGEVQVAFSQPHSKVEAVKGQSMWQGTKPRTKQPMDCGPFLHKHPEALNSKASDMNGELRCVWIITDQKNSKCGYTKTTDFCGKPLCARES